MSEHAKISPDGLSLTLEPHEVERVTEALMEDQNRAVLPGDKKPPTEERSGFARRACIRSSDRDPHTVGTKAGCPACEAYKASTVVRK